MRNLAEVASSPTLSLAGQTTLARVHVSEPRVGRPLLQSGRDDEDAFRGHARPCDAHSAPGCSVTCPRHRARRAGSTRTDQSFIKKKKKKAQTCSELFTFLFWSQQR